MLFEPSEELVPQKRAGGKREHDALLIIDVRIKGVPVQREEDFHRGMNDTLVAVDEWVALHQREAESCCLGDDGRIEVLTSEGGLRLGHSCLDGAEVTNACGATARLKNPLVE